MVYSTGPFYAVVRLGCSYMATVCITSTHTPICQALCKRRFSLDTWHAFAMASFSCLGRLDSAQLSFLSDTFMVRSSVSSKSLYSYTFINMVSHFAMENEGQ